MSYSRLPGCANRLTRLHNVKFVIVADGETVDFRRLDEASRRLDGGANRDRTDDLKLAKLALSQLSYGPKSMKDGGVSTLSTSLKWWAEKELNLRPHAYQACALTT